MTNIGRRRGWALKGLIAPLLVAVALPGVAHAQFSQGYKFLEAVKKKDGSAVESALSEPGSTIINTRDVTSGDTALHIVTARRDATWLGYLIGKGANVNARNNRGVTPLQTASNLGWLDGVSILLEGNARVDDSNDAGETPLIAAVHRRDLGMMRVLLKAGADPDRSDNSGRSARDYAATDSRADVLLGEIQASAKPKAQRPGGGGVYGPTF